MNLMTMLNRGAAAAPKPALNAAARRAIAAARAQWLNAMLVDQIRMWWEIGQRQTEQLQGLIHTLALAAYAGTHQNGGSTETPAVQAILRAIQAVEVCALNGAIMTAEYARQLSGACGHARTIVVHCNDASVLHAAQVMQSKRGNL